MGFISEFMADPRGTLILILLMLPGRLFALSMHEYAHARMAYRHGDDTAYMLGRLTMNPIKHIDPLGFLMVYIAGFGWAKPVPVNPRNFKGDVRKADFMVSIAGVLTNFIMFLLGGIALYAVIGVAVGMLPTVSSFQLNVLGTNEKAFVTVYEGVKCVFVNDGTGHTYWYLSDLLRYAPTGGYFIRLLWGDTPYYLFLMLSYFVQINIVLAIFNLLPIPPLDGYHVLNDLVLKRDLFASQRTMMLGNVVLIGLLVSGALSGVLGFVIEKAYLLLGSGAGAIFRLIGLL